MDKFVKIHIIGAIGSNSLTISEDVKAALIAATVTIFLGILSNAITIFITYSNSKEKKILSYGKFYVEYVALLVPLVLHCSALKLNLAKDCSRKLLTYKLIEYAYNNAASFSSEDEKRNIEQIYSILLRIQILYKSGSYYPMSKKVHKDVVKLEKVIETLTWLHKNNVEESQINDLKMQTEIPNLQKHIIDIMLLT